ncbi:MAG: FHA domain-containing protein [Pirellulaceae bacterium]|nr:FHA domain-containing protein [Pirellulaceae bacterium]
MEAKVVFIEGPDKGRSILLKKNEECLIGRGGKADFILTDQLISREHLRIQFDGRAISLTDLNSTNRTFVTGKPIPSNTPVTLRDNHFFVGTESCAEVEIISNEIKGTQATPSVNVPKTNQPTSPAERFQAPGKGNPETDSNRKSPGSGNFSVSVLPPHQRSKPTGNDSVIDESSLGGGALQYSSNQVDKSMPELGDDSFFYLPREDAESPPQPDPPKSGKPEAYMGSIAFPWEQGVKSPEQRDAPAEPNPSEGGYQEASESPPSPESYSAAGRSNFDLSATPEEAVKADNSSFEESVLGPLANPVNPDEQIQIPANHNASIASPDQYHARNLTASEPEPASRQRPGPVGNITTELQKNGLYFQSALAIESLEPILNQLAASYCVLLCLDPSRLAKPSVQISPAGDSLPSGDSANDGTSSNFEDSISGNPEGIHAAGSQPAAGIPLFDWIPQEADYRGPLLLELTELALPLVEVWQLDALCIFIGEDRQSMAEHLRHLRNLNFINGKQTDKLFGFCWPSVLHSVLESQSTEAVKRIMGDSLKAVLLEEPTEAFSWRLISQDLMLKEDRAVTPPQL